MSERYSFISFKYKMIILSIRYIQLNIITYNLKLNLSCRSCGGCAGTLISHSHVISASNCDQSMYLGYMQLVISFFIIIFLTIYISLHYYTTFFQSGIFTTLKWQNYHFRNFKFVMVGAHNIRKMD